jgi:hypothetical protein
MAAELAIGMAWSAASGVGNGGTPAHTCPAPHRLSQDGGSLSDVMQVIKQQHRQRASQLRVRAGEGEDVQGAEAAAAPSVPPGWELAQRVSGDAAALLMTGDPYNAELALKKGDAPHFYFCAVRDAEVCVLPPAVPTRSPCTHSLCSRPSRGLQASPKSRSSTRATPRRLCCTPSCGTFTCVPRRQGCRQGCWLLRCRPPHPPGSGLSCPPQTEDGRHEEALEHAQAAYDLMLGETRCLAVL